MANEGSDEGKSTTQGDSESAQDAASSEGASEDTEKIAIEVARLQHDQDPSALASQLIEELRNSDMSWALDPKAQTEEETGHEEAEETTDNAADRADDDGEDYQGLGKRRRDA